MTSFLDECKAYIGFDDDDAARLAALEPLLAPSFGTVCDAFYAAVASNPVTATILGDPGRAARLRVTLIDWMGSGLRGPHDDAFYQKRSRIGHRHVVIGLPQQYMFTAINVIRDTPIRRRTFPKWSLAYVGPSTYVQGLIQPMLAEPFTTAQTDKLVRLMREFAREGG